MKKLIKTLLCLGAVLVMSCALSCIVSAETLSNGDYTYTVLADSTAEITKYNGAETDVTIPDTLGGYTVTSVGKEAFSNCTSLESLIIPDTVKAIGNGAFAECDNLKNVILGNGVETLGNQAFGSCNSLTEITIPNSVTSCGGNLGPFYKSEKLTTVTFENGMTTIPAYVCAYATGLTTINFPSSVTVIGEAAFSNCPTLESLIIPDTVKTIGNGAFAECDSLKNVTLSNGVETLGNQAFGSCDSLTEITIPNSVTTCGGNLGPFYKSENLTTITFEDGMTTIPAYICSYATGLTTINFPSSVTVIGKAAFSNCSTLESLIIPDTVKTIEDGAFVGCVNLNNVTLGNGVETLGNQAFSYCNSLTEITIPNSVTSCGGNLGVFYKCENLTTIIFEDGLTTIPTFICSYVTGLTTVNIPSSVTTIEYHTFNNCDSLKKVIIPESVKTIDIYAFSSCPSLDTVLILSDYISIERNSFPTNENLTFFKKSDAAISTTATLNIINFTYADGVLSFSGEYKSDLYYLFDLAAMMCTYYDDVQYLFFASFEAVSADDGHIYYYTDNWERIEFDGTKITNVKFSIEAFDGEEFRKYSFNELCEAVGNNELENFNLVIEEADGLDRGNVEISLVDQINMSFQRILKAITNLINKIFSFFKRLGA